MTAGWWQQVYDLFSEAIALEPDERNALLQRRFAGDPRMRAEVERLFGQRRAGRTGTIPDSSGPDQSGCPGFAPAPWIAPPLPTLPQPD